MKEKVKIETTESPLDYSIRIKDGIQRKANSNKNLSTFLFLVILFSTVLSPIIILLGEDEMFSKVIPSLLMAGAALASYWIQLRKPHERWVIYRTAQREIEFQIDQFVHRNGLYEKSPEPERLLADRVSQRALQLHYEWIPMVPKAEQLNNVKKIEENV